MAPGRVHETIMTPLTASCSTVDIGDRVDVLVSLALACRVSRESGTNWGRLRGQRLSVGQEVVGE